MRDGQQHASITQSASEAERVKRLGPEGEDRWVQELRRRIHAQRILPFEVRSVGSVVSKPGRRVDEEAAGPEPQQAGLAEQGRNA